MTLHSAGTAIVLSRTQAATSGFSRFYTGKECKRGHLSERYTSNKQCVVCNAQDARKREDTRCLTDPSYRMYRNTLRRTGMALQGIASPVKALGCNHAKLSQYIADRFRIGMIWAVYRQWEVDHIKPLSLAQTEEQLIRLCHYTNLQPLWRRENRIKGGA